MKPIKGASTIKYTCWEVEYKLRRGDDSHRTSYYRSKKKAVEAINRISKNGGIVYSMGKIHRTVFDGFSETVGEYMQLFAIGRYK